jgi:acyl-CoA synthetase (AMP-forming)/AMP-acid ligase II
MEDKMGLRDLTIYHIIEHNARIFGTQPAVIGEGKPISHVEFLDRVNRLAEGLAQHGIEKGDRICILAQNSVEYFDLYGACALTGAIAYPINWRLSAEEVQYVFGLADPKMIAVGVGHIPQLEGIDAQKIPVWAIVGDGSAEGFIPLADFYLEPTTAFEEVSSDDPFVIISTAAVAGLPRGAVLTHRNLITAGYPLIAALGLNANDRHLAALPLFHITGLGLSLAVFQVGGANVIMEVFDPTQAAPLMDEHEVTLLADFPPILAMLLDARETSGAKWDSLRYVLGLDAPDVIQRLYKETNAKFWTGFGQSEITGVATLGEVMEKPGSAGRPVPLARVRCVDESGEDVPLGEPGEIVVRGPTVFNGYWRDPDVTYYAFRHDWHHTGDIGKFDEDGYLYYVGRMPEKELIKSGGENIYPAEVENVLQELPEVNAVCVFGVPDPEWGEAVKAVVEFIPGKSLTEEQIQQAVANRIASFKKPRIVEFTDTLPRGAEDRIDRAEVKMRFG